MTICGKITSGERDRTCTSAEVTPPPESRFSLGCRQVGMTKVKIAPNEKGTAFAVPHGSQ
jgi:hypothetical protein